MTNNLATPPQPPHTAIARRPLALGALGLLGALVLAGCGSPPRRSGDAAAGSAPPWQTRTSRTPPLATQPPLELDPRGREEAVALATLVINTPYTYGGNTPQGGFDCSGLVYYVFSHVAQGSALPRRLPRSTAEWAAATQPVDDAALQRGDLVFFNTTGALFSHMGIYVGQAQFVHAPSSGGTVRRDSLEAGYFRTRYVGARRVFAPA
jgi:Cell wall-associated hydrolases (invasion-associated proteins)